MCRNPDRFNVQPTCRRQANLDFQASQNFCTRGSALTLELAPMMDVKLPRRQFLHLAAGAAALAICCAAVSNRAWSQANDIRIVVTFPERAGGDLMTRAVADQISRSRGTMIVVENQSAPIATERGLLKRYARRTRRTTSSTGVLARRDQRDAL